MSIRHGRNEWPNVETYTSIDISRLAEEMVIHPGEEYADLRARLDPDRVTGILGLTQDGAYGGERVAAFGEKLLTNFALGADVLVVPPGSGFPVHVHSGHHLLICLAGLGTFSLNGEVHGVKPGQIAMIEGNVPHAVGNPYDQPHVLLAIGSPPKELDHEDRMTVVDWNGQPLTVIEDEDRLVEDKANGTAIIDTLKEQIEAGNVYLPLPSDKGNGWVTELLDELRLR